MKKLNIIKNKINKLLIILLLMLCCFLTGCSGLIINDVVSNENSITLKLEDDFASVIGGEIPEFTFNFNGNLNTIKNGVKSYQAIFSNNEDIILSDALNALFEQYKDRLYINLKSRDTVDTVLFSTLDENGNVKNLKYTPDNKEVFLETAYISLENGLKLTVDYCRFIYNGKTYYTWAMTHSINMQLYYPMMAIENKDAMKNKLVLITLPNRVTFSVGPTLDLSHILNGVSYIEDDDCMYYTFKYIVDLNNDGKEDELEIQQQYIIDYYVNEYNGEYIEYETTVLDEETKEEKVVINKEVTYTYLGNTFVVKLYESNFKMHYVSSN